MKTRRRRTSFFTALLSALLLHTAAPPLPAGYAHPEGMVTVYFPNWNIYSYEGCQVKDLPWDRLDRIYHAFWKITETKDGYSIISPDPWADTDASNPKAHFPQYERLSAQYPDTEILLSVGGWTYSGLFSEMALTKESRASFIQSCLDFLSANPCFDGIDLDWEYPGVHRSASASDEGSPVAGDDWTNYPLLLKELRTALDQQFGPGQKLLTVCAAGGVGTLRKQDYPTLHPYVDAINLMTYDLTSSSNRTAHHSPLYGPDSADTAVQYMLTLGIPADKLFIGTPLYNHGWKGIDLDRAHLIGSAANGKNHGGTMLWRTLQQFEAQSKPASIPGWHKGYDEDAAAAYLWNDDPHSPYYRNFLSYESARSLQKKLNYILEKGLGGIIVWQSGGDDHASDYPMITQMYRGLHSQKD